MEYDMKTLIACLSEMIEAYELIDRSKQSNIMSNNTDES